LSIENSSWQVTNIEENTSTEAQALSEIVTWSADCPEWQKDALRRLCSKDKLEQDDITALLAICKGEQEGEQITADHIRDPAASNVEVSLSKLHNVRHVNALQSGETLQFCKTGLTVIYGDNGAGKSGYARVLKQACRARGDDNILPNIYAAQSGTPQAEIAFRIGNQNHNVTWKKGIAADPRLTAISVFDSRAAGVHVDGTNNLAYTPAPLRIMAALADTCKEIKDRHNDEISFIEARMPDILKNPPCSADTDVGKLISSLSAKTLESKIEELVVLSDEEAERLKTLAADLASDPARLARQLQNQKQQIDRLKEQLESLFTAVSDNTITEIRRLHKSYTTARDAASLVSQDMLSGEPLPNVGSDVWRSLWESARTYSDKGAYPDRTFPATEDDARCVLCHQELTPEASARLNSFEKFVLDDSKKREDDALKAYQATYDAMKSHRLKQIHKITAMLRDDIGNEAVAGSIKQCAIQNAWRLRAILRSIDNDDAVLPVSNAVPRAALSELSQFLETRANTFLTEQDSPQRKALIAEHNDLADRQWLGTVKADVLEQIKRLKEIDRFKTAQKTANTTKITNLNKELATGLVTDRLRAHFSQEIARLGIAEQHAIELKHAKTTAGIPLFHVRMISRPDKPVGDILSEGEHRCVALAAFLAELSTTDTQSTIVFDDPVSSLDHIHRDRVAARLATESLNRQVVIFTHDIAFLMLLEDACRKTRDREAIPIAYRVVSRGLDATGFCNTEPPANVLPVEKVVDKMRANLQGVKIHHERGNTDEWRKEVRSFAEQLREAWERAVEEAVSPVIKRLAHKVKTDNLIRLTVLEAQDCHTMRDAYGRCSQFLHSQPGELNPRLPTPQDIENEIAALEAWGASIKDRQAQTA
jgi:energy-coupling factor transporter ATP-binding protein EcfA2